LPEKSSLASLLRGVQTWWRKEARWGSGGEESVEAVVERSEIRREKGELCGGRRRQAKLVFCSHNWMGFAVESENKFLPPLVRATNWQ